MIFFPSVTAMDFFREHFGERVDVSTDAPTGFNLSTSDQSLVVSILSVGTFFGSLIGAPLADRIGRRYGIQAAMVVFVVSRGTKI